MLPRILAYAVDSKTAAWPFDGRLGLTVPGHVLSQLRLSKHASDINGSPSGTRGPGKRSVSASKFAIKWYSLIDYSLPYAH